MQDASTQSDWLQVVGKSLAYLCLFQMERQDANRFKNIVDKVKFLQGLGLTQADAAEVVGSTPASVAEMLRRTKQKGKRNGKTKKGK